MLAVAASVTILAVSHSASQGLTGSQQNFRTPCQPWEIYDPMLEASGLGGGNRAEFLAQPNPPEIDAHNTGGVVSSATGCIAPCYLILRRGDYTVDLAISQSYAHHHLPIHQGLPFSELQRFWEEGDLKYDDSNRLPQYESVSEPGWGANGGWEFEVRIGVVHALGFLSEHRYHRTDTFIGQLDETGANIDTIVPYTTTRSRWHGNFYFLDSTLGDPIRSYWAAGRHARNPQITPIGWAEPPFSQGSNMAIRADRGEQACDVYDTNTEEILASSDWRRVGEML